LETWSQYRKVKNFWKQGHNVGMLQIWKQGHNVGRLQIWKQSHNVGRLQNFGNKVSM
jgi:hypothetical protein